MHLDNTQKGILYMLLSSALFGLMGLVVKVLSTSSNPISSVELVFFRSIFGVLVLFASFYHIPNSKLGGKPWLLIFRGLIGFVALLMFFYNLTHLTIAQATVFSKTSPIFTTILAFFFFKEHLHKSAWFAVFLGFIGIIFITGFEPRLDKTDLLGILSGLLAALAYSSVKELRKHYDSRVIVLSFTLIGSIGPMILMGLGTIYEELTTIESLDFIISPFTVPQGIQWFHICVLGAVSTAAQILMTKSYGYAKAGIVSTISYSTIAFSIFFGFFIGDPLPSLTICIGIALVVVSGILVSQ